MLCCKALPHESAVCGFASRLRAYLTIVVITSSARYVATTVVPNRFGSVCLNIDQKKRRENFAAFSRELGKGSMLTYACPPHWLQPAQSC
ncbi:hypothetical protein SDC9_108997 [bioreactor metagenome]|uniref:Uncharacterized protein n=1 Tax=bioreactor metagenome TaxID=1076179 RepID=A0A645BBU2_9ZZZZ